MRTSMLARGLIATVELPAWPVDAGVLPPRPAVRLATKCKDCHRSLRTRTSRERGYGPDCYRKRYGQVQRLRALLANRAPAGSAVVVCTGQPVIPGIESEEVAS